MNLAAAILGALCVYLAIGLIFGVSPSPVPRLGHLPGRVTVWLQHVGGGPLQWASALAAGLTVGVAGVVATGNAFLAAVLALAAAGAVLWYRTSAETKRRAEASRAWPDALRQLATTVRSGRSLASSIRDLDAGGPPGLRASFTRYRAQERMFGAEGALELIRADLADPLTDRVIEVLVVGLRRGGPLIADLLVDLADAAGRDVRTAEEIETNSLELRLNARIVVVVPWAILALLVARPGPYREFYASAAGSLVIAIAAFLSVLGLILMARFGRIRSEPRVLGTGHG